ncbi:MAG: hypothetical protein ACR2NP_09600, partial [Pirellulaceae bacterium]
PLLRSASVSHGVMSFLRETNSGHRPTRAETRNTLTAAFCLPIDYGFLLDYTYRRYATSCEEPRQ